MGETANSKSSKILTMKKQQAQTYELQRTSPITTLKEQPFYEKYGKLLVKKTTIFHILFLGQIL